MKKSIFACLVILFLSGINSGAQDIAYSQQYANPLYLNPAFAGTGNTQRVGLNFRDQWPAIPGNLLLYNASYDRNIFDTNNGVGVLANMERAGQGTVITDNASIIYSHQFHIKSFTLSAGVEGTYFYKSIHEEQLTFNYPPIRGFTYTYVQQLTRTSLSAPDFSAGLLGYGKNYFVGFSAAHLTQPDESFVQGVSPLYLKYTANAGLIIPVGNGISIIPSLIYERQSYYNMQEVEGYVTKGHFTVGIGTLFANQNNLAPSTEEPNSFLWNSMVFTAGFQCQYLRIGYSYNAPVSEFLTPLGGTHEVSLAVMIPYFREKFMKVNGIQCPAF